MARLSQGLIQGMMNPAYSDNLAGNVGNGFQAIQDGYTARRERHAGESLNAILSDGTDAQHVKDAQAVGAQMGMDPVDVQARIEAQKAATRAEEDQKMQKEQHLSNQAAKQYQLDKAADEKAEKFSVASAVSKVGKNPDKIEEIIGALPVEHQTAARIHIQEKQKFEVSLAKYKEEIKDKEPFKPETISAMGETEGMEQSIAVYEKMKEQFPSAAKKMLVQQYTKVKENELMMGRYKAKADAPLRDHEIKRALTYVDSVELAGTGFGGAVARAVGMGSQNPEMYKAAVAKKLAIMGRDPEFVPTPEIVQQLVYQVQEEEAAKIAEREAAEGVTPGSPDGKQERRRGRQVDQSEAAAPTINAVPVDYEPTEADYAYTAQQRGWTVEQAKEEWAKRKGK